MVTPDNSVCKFSWLYRLNLPKGKGHTLVDDKLELNGLVFRGRIKVAHHSEKDELEKQDSFYQVHGKVPYQRDVFMTLGPEDEASRLICGITRGEPGKWTSWPPHQHTEDLEEVYCYFDIPKPKSAFHFSSRREGEFEHIHPVSTGDCVLIPEGYHPTCGMPGVSSCYFWVMAAHRPESRRYDLAVNDPSFQ